MENVKNTQETKAVTLKPAFKSSLSKMTETYTNSIVATFADIHLDLDAYQKVCLANAIAKINELLTANDLAFNSPNLEQSNITTVLSQIAMFKLNPAASPRECYFQLRNSNGKKLIEFGVEGNGNDAILRTYGVNVKEVMPPIVIREGDEFNYPYFDGEKMQPFTWKPHSFTAKPIAVAYVVTKNDGTKEYLISERESVATNLKAHIANNLMSAEKDVKNRILNKIKDMSLDAMLSDPELLEGVETMSYGKPKTITLISPAWKSPQSREEMIIRKMKNNCTKKYPKDFKNSYVAATYETTAEDAPRREYIDAETQYSTPEEVVQQAEEKAGTEAMPEVEVQEQKQEPKDNLEAIFADVLKEDKKPTPNQGGNNTLFPDLE